MKLQELGLKTKPENKVFPHGTVVFSTVEKELFYQISFWQTKSLKVITQPLPVIDKNHFTQLMNMTAKEVQAQ
jgi:hypothetical protein